MPERSAIQKASFAFGAVFLLIGILGFVPGIVGNYGELSFAGPNSAARLLGLFQISVLHNLVHAAFGVAGLAAARSVPAARGFLLFGGVVYLVLTAYGAVIDHDSAANFVPVNAADNLLHLILGLGMVGAGVALGKRAGAANIANRT